jgi:XTP/dITP diphosphohydrolase
MELVFATNNAHKLGEVSAMLPPGIRVLGLDEAGFSGDIPETGSTLEENAEIKARTIFDFAGRPVIADDTGLFVHALDGAPGVYSARYAGEHAAFADNCALLLKNLERKPDRKAEFVTVVCLVDSHGKSHFFRGEVGGSIALQMQGDKGFGYDPLFLPDGATRSFAQMTATEKNAISHRRLAMQQLITYLHSLGT